MRQIRSHIYPPIDIKGELNCIQLKINEHLQALINIHFDRISNHFAMICKLFASLRLYYTHHANIQSTRIRAFHKCRISVAAKW